MDLRQLGWNEALARAFQPHAEQGHRPARVATEYTNELYRLYLEQGEVLGQLAGRLRHHAETRADLPAVGDWVAVTPLEGEDKAVIHAVLPRQSKFSRKVAGRVTEEQVVAANVTTILLVMGLDEDYSPRRLERYLTMAWESGAQPVVVLNKVDLCEDLAAREAEIASIAVGAEVIPISALQGTGLERLAAHVVPGATVALLGSSGVGKSTVINRLVGQEVLKTAEVRASDSTGKHTTTRRELILLPSGGLVMDTPGMRELQVWEAGAGVSGAFDDIERLAEWCRFSDCTHHEEPGCAVRAALDSGELEAARLESYFTIQRELQHLERRQDKLGQIEEKKKAKVIERAVRRMYRGK
jgi:ribosome biogenesis GTPase / thiamine phosphate phosphatase